VVPVVEAVVLVVDRAGVVPVPVVRVVVMVAEAVRTLGVILVAETVAATDQIPAILVVEILAEAIDQGRVGLRYSRLVHSRRDRGRAMVEEGRRRDVRRSGDSVRRIVRTMRGVRTIALICAATTDAISAT